MEVSIIGTGNTATVLGRAIRSAGHRIAQVAGRNQDHAQRLATELGAAYAVPISDISSWVDIIIIAVSDAAIPEVAAGLRPGPAIVVHTAGAVEAEVLQYCSVRYGVLYPLQSLRGETGSLPEMPLLVDAGDGETRQALQHFARTFSSAVQVAGNEQRMALHVAAVTVSNFTNHLYALAEQWCNRQQVDFRLLLPLITEVTARLQHFSPAEVQTGPAARGDMESIAKHLRLLEGFPALEKVYNVLTNSILENKNQV